MLNRNKPYQRPKEKKKKRTKNESSQSNIHFHKHTLSLKRKGSSLPVHCTPVSDHPSTSQLDNRNQTVDSDNTYNANNAGKMPRPDSQHPNKPQQNSCSIITQNQKKRKKEA